MAAGPPAPLRPCRPRRRPGRGHAAVRARRRDRDLGRPGGGDCGYGVQIHSPDHRAAITYCHLTTIEVTAGTAVAVGQPIGTSGGAPGQAGAGRATGPHLHLLIDTPQGRRCPQALLLGLWRGWPIPAIASLRTDGCTYTGPAPPPQSPVPIPPDLPEPTS